MAEDRLGAFGGQRRRLLSSFLGVLLGLLVRALLLLEFSPLRFGELFFFGGLPSLARLSRTSALRLAFSAAFLAFSSSVGWCHGSASSGAVPCSIAAPRFSERLSESGFALPRFRSDFAQTGRAV